MRLMWEPSVSWGCALMYGLWVAAFALIGIGWSIGSPALQNVGLALTALAAALTVMRDNQQTRRIIRRASDGEERLHPVR